MSAFHYHRLSGDRQSRRLAAVLFTVMLLLTGFCSVLLSQGQENITTTPGQPATASNTQGRVAARTTLEDYNPIAAADMRFSVGNINFDRRYAGNGLGEFLDVVFEVRNLTSQPFDLYGFVIAYYETDAVDRTTRSMIPYPSWRSNDPARDQFLIHYLTVTPDIRVNRDEDKLEGNGQNDHAIMGMNDQEIWDEHDPDYTAYKRIIQRMRDSVASSEPVQFVNPPLWKVLSYVINTPSRGLRFTLRGENMTCGGTGPGAGQNAGPQAGQQQTAANTPRINEIPDLGGCLQTNYSPPTPDEKRTRQHKALVLHKYTLEHTRRLTTFRSHHFSKFRANYVFFNSIAILLFDAEKAAEYEKQMAPIVQERAAWQAKWDTYQESYKNYLDKVRQAGTDQAKIAALEGEKKTLEAQQETLLGEQFAMRTRVSSIPTSLVFKRLYRLERPLREL